MPIHPSLLPPTYTGKTHTRPDLWVKASSYVAKSDYALINSVLASSGGISYIIDSSIHGVAEVIRARGWRFPDDTSRLIQWLRERSFGESPPVAQGQTSDVGRGAPSGGDGVANPSHVPAGSRETTSQSSSGVGGRGVVEPERNGTVTRRDKIREAAKRVKKREGGEG